MSTQGQSSPKMTGAVMKTIRTRLTAWVTRNLIADDPNPEYSRLDRTDGLNKHRPTVLAGCMDCEYRSVHHTTTSARAALEAHSFDAPGHRALVSDDSGWHRAFGAWLADGPRISGGTPARNAS